jgi:hypothetical protein
MPRNFHIGKHSHAGWGFLVCFGFVGFKVFPPSQACSTTLHGV